MAMFNLLEKFTCKEFEEHLATARTNAYTNWEKIFIEDLWNRYIMYGVKLNLTEKVFTKLVELQHTYEERKPTN